jgi:hypothetical protein
MVLEFRGGGLRLVQRGRDESGLCRNVASAFIPHLNGDPKKFFEFADKPPSQLVRYDKEWWFVAN